MLPIYLRAVGEYVIRQSTRKDIPEVIAINYATLPEHYSDLFVEELLSESPETFLVSEKNETIVGYIMCRTEFGFSNVKRFGLTRKGHIVSIAVLEEHRNKRLGRSLIEEAQRGMVSKGCSETYLEVRVSNKGAINLYEKLGFQKTTIIEGYYKDGEAAHLMAKALP